MCMKCGNCSKQHSHTIDDAIDSMEDLDYKN